jgi:hypothetical protein
VDILLQLPVRPGETSVQVQEDQATRRDEYLDPSDDTANQAEGTAG